MCTNKTDRCELISDQLRPAQTCLNPLHSKGKFSCQLKQSVRYVHSCLELVVLIPTSTNDLSQTSVGQNQAWAASKRLKVIIDEWTPWTGVDMTTVVVVTVLPGSNHWSPWTHTNIPPLVSIYTPPVCGEVHSTTPSSPLQPAVS